MTMMMTFRTDVRSPLLSTTNRIFVSLKVCLHTQWVKVAVFCPLAEPTFLALIRLLLIKSEIFSQHERKTENC